MKFRKFIKEMPHSSAMQRSVVKCPYGHNPNLKSPEFAYDYAAEMIGDVKWLKLAQKTIGVFGDYKLPFPVVCLRHNLVFIYDFKKKKYFAPRNDNELKMCEKLILGLQNEEKNPHLKNKRFTIYGNENNK